MAKKRKQDFNPKRKPSSVSLVKELQVLKRRVSRLEKKIKYCDGDQLPPGACGTMDD